MDTITLPNRKLAAACRVTLACPKCNSARIAAQTWILNLAEVQTVYRLPNGELEVDEYRLNVPVYEVYRTDETRPWACRNCGAELTTPDLVIKEVTP